MEQPLAAAPRVAAAAECASVARLLDTFNREYDTPTPGAAVLTTRLERLLADGDVIALLAGDPAVAVGPPRYARPDDDWMAGWCSSAQAGRPLAPAGP